MATLAAGHAIFGSLRVSPADRSCASSPVPPQLPARTMSASSTYNSRIEVLDRTGHRLRWGCQKTVSVSVICRSQYPVCRKTQHLKITGPACCISTSRRRYRTVQDCMRRLSRHNITRNESCVGPSAFQSARAPARSGPDRRRGIQTHSPSEAVLTLLSRAACRQGIRRSAGSPLSPHQPPPPTHFIQPSNICHNEHFTDPQLWASQYRRHHPRRQRGSFPRRRTPRKSEASRLCFRHQIC